jgi:hypothetical protein
MTAADDVTHTPNVVGRSTLRLTSSHSGAMPENRPTRARGT